MTIILNIRVNVHYLQDFQSPRLIYVDIP